MRHNLHRDAARALANAERLLHQPNQWIDPDEDRDEDEQLNLSPEGRAFIASVTRHALDHPGDRLGLRELLNQHLVANGGRPLAPKKPPADPGADHRPSGHHHQQKEAW
ncbi:hypothetical protein [Rathayibacter festucae]|uniref:Uncharacterized protein n=1 Tax=Rathayibacter festucae DSM 15932 TaxID=1328866 RepID=A0A3Q9UTH7_9MICO|nr:hypothetical protein [Rathayibacter festucae]AZZ52812.1 hypothetical protein C1I64_12680 [Rathayibacter festucae DSM 15932]